MKNFSRAPVAPRLHDQLTLQFAAAMAPSVLTRAFVREYAWLAVHPTGARVWNSAARLSSASEGLVLDSPEIKQCQMRFRGLVGDGAALVLEILELPSKSDPVRRLEFTHPTLKKRIPVLSEEGFRERKAKQAAKVEKEHEIDSQPSRVSSRPDVADAPKAGNDFIGDRGAVERSYILQEVAQTSTSSTEDAATSMTTAEASDSALPPEPQRRIIPVSGPRLRLWPNRRRFRSAF